MITLSERNNTVHIVARKALTSRDYERILPLLNQAIEHHENCSLLFEMRDFNGDKIDPCWHDLKFELRNAARVKRIALVGEHDWKISMKNIMRHFLDARINFFEDELLGVAKAWASKAPTFHPAYV